MSNDNRQNQANINWYPGHMAKTKRLLKEKEDLIDLVYEIIDARIPYSSKIRDMDSILQKKPRILIFNKADLCDKIESEKWASFYEKKGLTVLFADLEHQKDMKILLSKTKELMEPVRLKRLEKGLKPRKIRIAIIGIPNVGKSTLINRLVGKKAVNVGNRPGITKSLDWIRINDDLELLDTPGILWPKLDSDQIRLNLASFTAIKEEILPLDVVALHILTMLDKYYKEILKQRYGIDKVEDPIIAYDTIAKKRGCLMRGGEIDYDRVIALILQDIKTGAIKQITFDRYQDE